jgi:hypothetical protein
LTQTAASQGKNSIQKKHKKVEETTCNKIRGKPPLDNSLNYWTLDDVGPDDSDCTATSANNKMVGLCAPRAVRARMLHASRGCTVGH